MTDLYVEVHTKDIVVTLSGTNYKVAYYKPRRSSQLSVWSYGGEEEQGGR
jgi:hypothetical protein